MEDGEPEVDEREVRRQKAIKTYLPQNFEGNKYVNYPVLQSMSKKILEEGNIKKIYNRR